MNIVIIICECDCEKNITNGLKGIGECEYTIVTMDVKR